MNACGAKTRSGTHCRRAARPNGRCNLHGGKSTGGPLTAGGRHSKYLPTRLAARVEESLTDPELISQRADIAVIDARLSELFQRLDTTETSVGWVKAWNLRQKEKAGGAEGLKAGFDLDGILEAGLKDSQTWAEIAAFIEQRRRCAETEQKRLAQLDQFITAKQANVLMAAVIRLVTDHVPDPDTRGRIAAGLVQLVTVGDQRGDTEAGGTLN